ncbi:Zinc finger and BTB domain-containing protein 14 [Plakobranchus ocellatus]|uniref:Zinc finger and BTB domain-containing protein 14 n=1 Tax=Plakobranchus ocellatus TaxID=259542 RepID=A0AAV3YDH2_9GAST|nr:Zinc finger and BTB domain-containing protein 14 [Plakobranchus ocellatus]
MPEVQMDVAVANRFISSLSKSLQALCHGCMDFDSGIEIVGYINVNIDCGSKVDYVLNEKVLKSTTNSMTFVSNSFLAKKDVPKQTRDGACSPIPELKSLHQNSYFRGAYQGSRSSMQFSHSYGQRGSQKRSWPGLERDWRISPKKYRGGRIGSQSNYQGNPILQNPPPAQSSMSRVQSAEPDFKMPMSSEETSLSDASQSTVNIKKEITDSDSIEQALRSDLEKSSTEQSNDDSLQATDLNIKKDPDAEDKHIPLQTQEDDNPPEDPSANNANADFKGTFLQPEDAPNLENNIEGTVDPIDQMSETNRDSNLLAEQSDINNIPSEFAMSTNDSVVEHLPSGSGEFTEAVGEESYSQSAYSDAGEGSSDTGQFEVIEIEDEDEDVQGLFGDSRENGKGTKRRYRRALKAARKKRRNKLQDVDSDFSQSKLVSQEVCKEDLSGLYGQRSSVEICSFCRIALPMGTTYQQHFSEVHMSESADPEQGETCPYTCEICQKTFVTKERLRQHSSVHDTALYSCFVCDVKFKHKKNIKRHIETTHGLKKCAFCMALFTKGEEFDKHVLYCVNCEKGEIQDFGSLCTY